MTWEVEHTDEFDGWWDTLDDPIQNRIAAKVGLLEALGPTLGFPHSSNVNGSQHSHMRELRIQISGEPYRILYAFDPRRTAILLIGGNKGGDNRWYEQFIPVADQLYDVHLVELRKEGLIE